MQDRSRGGDKKRQCTDKSRGEDKKRQWKTEAEDKIRKDNARQKQRRR